MKVITSQFQAYASQFDIITETDENLGAKKKGEYMLKTNLLIAGGMILCLLFLIPNILLAGDRFRNNGDGTITDHRLRVMWAERDNQGDIDWKYGEQWTKYTFPYTLKKIYGNWRLPTLREIQSLYLKEESEGHATGCGKQVRIVPLIKLSCNWIWTSEKNSDMAKAFNFNDGTNCTNRISHKKGYRVLPVRFFK